MNRLPKKYLNTLEQRSVFLYFFKVSIYTANNIKPPTSNGLTMLNIPFLRSQNTF